MHTFDVLWFEEFCKGCLEMDELNWYVCEVICVLMMNIYKLMRKTVVSQAWTHAYCCCCIHLDILFCRHVFGHEFIESFACRSLIQTC